MSFTSKIFTLGSAGGIAYADDFFATYGIAGQDLEPQGHDVRQSSAGTIAVTGYKSTTTDNGYLFATTNQGELIGSVETTEMDVVVDVSIDAVDGNYYVVGYDSNTSNLVMVMRLNTSFQRQWHKEFSYSTGGSTHSMQAIKELDSSYVILAGYLNDPNNSQFGFATASIRKSDGGVGSTGNEDFVQISHDQSNQFQGYKAMDFDSSQRLYIGGMTQRTSPNRAYITCQNWDSGSGRHYSRAASKGLGSSNGFYTCQALVQEGGSVFASGYHDDTSYKVGTTKDAWLVKYNTGTLAAVWERGFGVSGTAIEPTDIKADGTYIYTLSRNSPNAYITAHNYSGTLVWQRKLSGTSTTWLFLNLDTSNNKLVVLGRDASTSDTQVILARLPTDGSGTGTYGPYTYATTTDITTYNINPDNSPEENYDNQRNYNPSRTLITSVETDLNPQINNYYT